MPGDGGRSEGLTSVCVGDPQVHRGNGTVCVVAVILNATCLARPRLLDNGD